MLSPFSQVCLNTFLKLEGTSLCYRYQMFRMFWVYLLYLSFTSAKTWSLKMTHFKYLNELSIKKCNNQSNAIHITQQHPITCTIIIIDLSYLLRNFSKLINIYYIYMNVKCGNSNYKMIAALRKFTVYKNPF